MREPEADPGRKHAKHRFAFRADASAKTGGGHVMRCMTLASALLKWGQKIAFLSQPGTVQTVPPLGASGMAVIEVTAEPSSWIEGLNEWHAGGVDCLVIDSYGVGAEQERAMRGTAKRIMVIDDLANRAHDCDILLDQNLGRTAASYAGLVPSHCEVLAGPRYALLRPEFAQARPRALARRGASGPVERILISMGMTDVGGVTARVLEAVLTADTGAAIDVVIGSRAPSLARVRALAARDGPIALHIDNADMCELMVAADLGIGAAGSTSWERCCLGLASIVMVLADNQREGAAALAGAGAALAGTDQLDASSAGLTAAVRRLSSSSVERATMAASAAGLADGQGVRRCLARIVGLELVAAALEHSADIWRWRNDPATRAASKDKCEIDWATHSAWYDRVLADGGRIQLVAFVDGRPCGVVRFDPAHDEQGNPSGHLVSINLAPEVRGQGLGVPVLGEACDRVRALRPMTIHADIAMDNPASQRIFAACGFVAVAAPDQSGFTRYALFA